MSIRKFMDTISDCFESLVACTRRTYRFLKGLSFKSKAHVDLQLKSKKHLNPICRCGFDCNKEVRILPLIYWFIGAVFILSLMFSSKDNRD